jgi:hypothetical protein
MSEKCHICGKEATTTCPLCGRPICDEHKKEFPPELQDAFGPYACTACYDEVTGLIEKDRARQAKRKKQPVELRTCAICGKTFKTVLPRCSVCGRPVCHDHRMRYRKKFYSGSPGPERAWYWDRDVRCLDHKRKFPGLRGWEVDPDDEPEEEAKESSDDETRGRENT